MNEGTTQGLLVDGILCKLLQRGSQRILQILLESGEALTYSQIKAKYDQNWKSILRYLDYLAKAGLVERIPDGGTTRYQIMQNKRVEVIMDLYRSFEALGAGVPPRSLNRIFLTVDAKDHLTITEMRQELRRKNKNPKNLDKYVNEMVTLSLLTGEENSYSIDWTNEHSTRIKECNLAFASAL